MGGFIGMASNFDALRMHHFQYLAVVVVVCFSSSLLVPSRHHTDTSGQLMYAMMHLGSFAANLGAQLWVTFVAGLTMFYSLPRHMFGKVQSRLFPMFFLWSLVCSAITLSTFLQRHPVGSWELHHVIQCIALTTCFLTNGVNSLVIAPIIVSAMLKTFKMEVDAGVSNVVGYADMKQMKKNPNYCDSYRRFRRCHGISAMLVVVSVIANTVYLYYLANLCLPTL